MQPSTRRGGDLVLPCLFRTPGGGGAARVTSDTAPAISTGIATNTNAAAVASSAAAPGDITPGREGFVAATLPPPSLAVTRCRVGLQVSYTGVRAMLNPIIARPLTKSADKSHPKKTQ